MRGKNRTARVVGRGSKFGVVVTMIDEEQIEENAFDDTLRHLEVLSAQEGFDILQVEAELRSVEKYEGLDWVGRGVIKAAELVGTITAYQVFIMRYKRRNPDR